MTTLVLVRPLNLPLYFWTPYLFAYIRNSLGHLIVVDAHMIAKRIYAFSRIYVDIGLIHGLLNEILIDWNEIPFKYLVDYERTTFN